MPTAGKEVIGNEELAGIVISNTVGVVLSRKKLQDVKSVCAEVKGSAVHKPTL